MKLLLLGKNGQLGWEYGNRIKGIYTNGMFWIG
jgi:dTDP-4-dehydrorhamnose reductase